MREYGPYTDYIPLSSNEASFDMQVSDAVSWLQNDAADSAAIYATMSTDFEVTFPEYDSLMWDAAEAMAYVDTELSGVDRDYMQNVAEWLEYHTPVVWMDGEPFFPYTDYH